MTYDPDNISARLSLAVFRLTKCMKMKRVCLHGRDAAGTGTFLVIPKTGSRNLLDADPQVLSN